MYTFYYSSHLNNLFNCPTCMSCTSTGNLISFIYRYGYAMIHVNSNEFRTKIDMYKKFDPRSTHVTLVFG